MNPIIKILIWFYLFFLAATGGVTHSIVVLFIAIGGSYYFLQIQPVFKDKPTEDK